jgi:hypothetical protein
MDVNEYETIHANTQTQVKVNEQHFFLLFYISVTKGSSTMIRTVKWVWNSPLPSIERYSLLLSIEDLTICTQFNQEI